MDPLDVAIVGAGMAGVYAGWRLRNAAEPRTVRILEGGPRVGGRLHSVVPEGMPHVRAEVGGMRIPTFHRLATGVIAELGLPTRPFLPEGGAENNLFYMRGQRLTLEDFAHPERVPYMLRSSEAGKTPAELFAELIRRILPPGCDHSAEEWDEARKTLTINGHLAADQGFEALLHRFASVEAINLLRDGLGYSSYTGNWNASAMLAAVAGHRHVKAELITLVDGMMSLPVQLAESFVQAGGQLSLEHRVEGLRRSDDGLLELDVSTPQGGETVRARHVILAMPRRALQLLQSRCFLFEHRSFVEDLQAVVPQPASKMFLGFRRPWWRDLGLRCGRSDTDLPMRQCYYFLTEGEQPGADAANTNSLLMAGYNDGGAVDFWCGFRGHAHLDASLEARWQAPRGADDLTAPADMVEEILRQLQQLHGAEVRVPDPYTAMFKDWAEDPYGGGWHAWQVHARTWEVMERMKRPVPGANVHVAGEAFSHEQGWVEGALATAEAVLTDELGLPAFEARA